MTGRSRPRGTVSLDRLHTGGPFAAFNDEERPEIAVSEAKAEYCRLNNELTGLRDERRPVSDREAKIAALQEKIETLRERAGIPAKDDNSTGRQRDQEGNGVPVEVSPERWSAL